MPNNKDMVKKFIVQKLIGIVFLLKLQMWKLIATWKCLWCNVKLQKTDNEKYIDAINITM